METLSWNRQHLVSCMGESLNMEASVHGCCSGLCLVSGGGARVVSCHGQLLVTVVTQPCSPPHSLFVMLHTSHFIGIDIELIESLK